MVKYVQQILSSQEIPNTLRKLRKKLRQIENLEQINNRVLTKEEEDKVASKNEIRKDIFRLTAQLDQDSNSKQPLINLTHEDDPSTPLLSSQIDETSEKSAFDSWQEIISGAKDIIVSNIDGHHDIIYDVAADDEFIVTCSRDTTVKVWDAITGSEVTSLRGHKSGVSAVLLLTRDQGNEVMSNNNKHVINGKMNDRIVLTGGYDCMVCMWSVKTGELMKSVYVYNSVTCMTLCPTMMRLLLGTDGGKIEIWDVFNLKLLNSLLTYEDSIAKIEIVNDLAYVASSDGLISVMRIVDDSIACLYSSENVALVIGDELKCVHDLRVIGEFIYYGDDGANIKMLNWRTGFVEKISNHCKNYGSTNALALTEKEIIASSYNIETGTGSLNVFKVPENQYIGSISDGASGKILSIAISRNVDGHLRIITVGTEFKVWDIVSRGYDTSFKADEQKRVKMEYIPEYKVHREESDNDDSDSLSGSSENNTETGRFVHLYFPQEQQPEPPTAFGRWCSIL